MVQDHLNKTQPDVFISTVSRHEVKQNGTLIYHPFYCKMLYNLDSSVTLTGLTWLTAHLHTIMTNIEHTFTHNHSLVYRFLGRTFLGIFLLDFFSFCWVFLAFRRLIRSNSVRGGPDFFPRSLFSPDLGLSWCFRRLFGGREDELWRFWPLARCGNSSKKTIMTVLQKQ